jgi:hypothetical protein
LSARVRHRWNNRERVRSTGELASALGANVWKISAQAVVELENQNFEINTYAQRLDVLAEFCAYQLQLVDRLMHARGDEGARAEFITALALHLAETMQDNRVDAQQPGEHREAFVALLNERTSFYATCRFDSDAGPSFVLRRNFGDRVAAVVGERDRKWVTDYVMDVQAPALMQSLRRAMPSLFQ